jgi:Ca2+/Na+ antiporter
MDTNNNNLEPEQKEKQKGGINFFVFLGVLVILLVGIKLFIDWFQN